MHGHSEISPVASCLVHEEKLSFFDMFHKLKYIKQCNFVVTFIQWKDNGWLQRGGWWSWLRGIHFYTVPSWRRWWGPNDLFISCHVLGSVDVMLWFIHAVGLLKLAVLIPVHECTQQHYGVCMWYEPTLAYLRYLVPVSTYFQDPDGWPIG